MMATDDLHSMKLDDDQEHSPEQDDGEEMEDLVMNPNGYDEKLDLDEDRLTYDIISRLLCS